MYVLKVGIILKVKRSRYFFNEKRGSLLLTCDDYFRKFWLFKHGVTLNSLASYVIGPNFTCLTENFGNLLVQKIENLILKNAGNFKLLTIAGILD